MTGRPYIEACALLAGHGHAVPPPRSAMVGAPLCRSPGRDVRFALWGENRARKPWAFRDINALARRIHRERGEATIEVVPVRDLEIEGAGRAMRGASVFVASPDGDRPRLIGHAYFAGQDIEVLREAIRRNRPAEGLN